MKLPFRKHLTLARLDLLNATAYLKPFLISKVFLVFILFIMFSLYRALYAGRAAVSGFTIPMVLYYLTVTETVEMSKVRIYQTISEEIKDGSCAYTLLRPLSYLSYHFFSNAARMGLNAAIVLAVGLATTSLLTAFDAGVLLGVILSLPALAMAVTLNFMAMFIIGLLAFSMEEVGPVYWIYQKLLFIVGGLLMPLEFFPDWLRRIAEHLPTAYISYFPAKLAVHWDTAYFLRGFTIQLAYTALFLLLAQWMFTRGMKRVQINGG